MKPAQRESRLIEVLSAASGPMNARQIAEAIEPGNLTTLQWCRKVLPLMVADGRLVKSQDPNFGQTCHVYSLAAPAQPVAAEVMEPETTETATVESQALSLFNYKSMGAVRVAMIDGAPWFCLKDVCEVLLIANPWNVATRLDADEKGDLRLADAIGRYQKTTFVNQSGLFAVLLRSDKPEAKPFRKWVTAEVLPSIFNTGSYSVSQPPKEQKPLSQLEMISLMAQEAVKNEKRLFEIEAKVDRLLLRREQAEKDLAALPPATVTAAPKTTRALVAELVANYCKATSVEFVDAHRKLHKEFYYRHHINLNKRFLANRDKYKSKLDIVEDLGMMEQYYAIALEVLVAPKEGSADL